MDSAAGLRPGALRRARARASLGGAPLRWLSRRTLRGRLIAALLALLALGCAVVGGVTYFAIRSFLLIQLDDQLQTAWNIYATACQRAGGPPQDPDWQPQYHDGPGGPDCGTLPGQPLFTLDAMVQGRQFTSQLPSGQCHLPAWEQTALSSLPVNGRPYTKDLTSQGGDYRLTARRLGSGGPVLITGLPMASMQGILHDVEITELAVFAGALVLTGVLGTGLVRVSLRPLRRVAATATRVAQLPLGDGQAMLTERVPETNPRTEVGQLTTAFNRMLGHVESSLARRAASEARLRRFAADASHELRTPLASIRGYAELARRHPGPVPADVAHALDRVEAESARMSALVDELLLLARLDAGRPLASEHVDLSRLAIDAVSDARAAGAGHRWVLELPAEPVSVQGDEHRLRQVIANLLGNARVHTPAGTAVTLRLEARDSQHWQPGGTAAPGAVRLSVSDDGPGVPAGLQASLFDRFVRGDGARTRETGGTGLGLAIVAAVVAAHHGTVTVTSRPGLTSFVVTLPGGAPAAPPTDR